MSYRVTLLENGSSRARHIFNRRIQATLAIVKSQLNPKLENKFELKRNK